jgi:hypothetical protein
LVVFVPKSTKFVQYPPQNQGVKILPISALTAPIKQSHLIQAEASCPVPEQTPLKSWNRPEER